MLIDCCYYIGRRPAAQYSSVGVCFGKVYARQGSDMKKPDAVTEIRRFVKKISCLWRRLCYNTR